MLVCKLCGHSQESGKVCQRCGKGLEAARTDAAEVQSEVQLLAPADVEPLDPDDVQPLDAADMQRLEGFVSTSIEPPRQPQPQRATSDANELVRARCLQCGLLALVGTRCPGCGVPVEARG